MKLVMLSDLHGHYYNYPIPDGDVLIIAGDITGSGALPILKQFCIRFGDLLPHKHKIVIAGNHDLCFEDQRRDAALEMLQQHGITYLENSGIQIEGWNFWGSPTTPMFYNWAFMKSRKELYDHWETIPNNTDVLITHGPCAGILDANIHGDHCGCDALLERVSQVKPRLHIFGHIHESHGMKRIDKTTFINCAILNDSYKRIFKPVEIELL